ncbi:hypothetical protein C2E23DRAFT_726441, partial [Lenzites betulinus]
QRLVHVARNALFYPTAGRRPQLLLLPCRDDWDPACGCPAYVEDLDTDEWMKGKQLVTSVDYFPGTRCRLINGYDIITLTKNAQRKPRRANETLRCQFAVQWPGALMVVKRARRERGRAIHITAPEIALVNTIVERYVGRGHVYVLH